MAVKIVRQPRKIAVLGAPTSAAAMSAGHEGAPAAFRAAGLIERLRSAGYEVIDHGDDPTELFQPDSESPRARNIPGILKSIESLKPRVEQAIKSGALPLILGGDCSIALGTAAGARRYFRHVSMIYMDADADLNNPATTPSGCVDGMVVSHLTGHGAPELVRFWSEPFLVREPDLALFGVSRLDAPEQAVLAHSPLRRFLAADVKRLGAGAAAQTAIERIRGNGNEFILHVDVDVISDFTATNHPHSGGLSFLEVREALVVFARQRHLAAIEITAYNPKKDPDGSAAKAIIDLLVAVFEARLESFNAAESAAAASAPPVPRITAEARSVPAAPAPAAETVVPEPVGELDLPEPVAGEGWSSESLDPQADAEAGTEISRHSIEDPEDEESSDSHF